MDQGRLEASREQGDSAKCRSKGNSREGPRIGSQGYAEGDELTGCSPSVGYAACVEQETRDEGVQERHVLVRVRLLLGTGEAVVVHGDAGDCDVWVRHHTDVAHLSSPESHQHPGGVGRGHGFAQRASGVEIRGVAHPDDVVWHRHAEHRRGLPRRVLLHARRRRGERVRVLRRGVQVPVAAEGYRVDHSVDNESKGRRAHFHGTRG
mmetsp:Transcript_86/g.405  ORF Transcript_86/g.405 Transcript_86/m.405 type:complete len:207 (-) Transcript_86:7573-8193(-)